MAFPFEFIQNLGSQKVATVGADGVIRQFDPDQTNMRQQWVRLPQISPEDGTFKIMNRSSNLVADAINGQTVPNTGLQQFVDTGNRNQRWTITQTELSETFYIRDDHDLVWDVPDSNDGTQIQLYSWNHGYNQRWRFLSAGALDIFSIRSGATDLLLEVRGYSQDDGALIHQAPDTVIHGNLLAFNQLWSIIDLPGASIKIMSVCSGKLLDYPLQSALQNQPASISQYADNGGANQRWFRDPVWYGTRDTIVSAVNGFVLDVPNGLPAPLVPIQAFPRNDGPNQSWIVRRLI